MDLTFASADIFLRGAATAVLLLVVVLFGAHARFKDRKGLALTIAGVGIGLIGYVLVSTPNLGLANGPSGVVLQALAATVPVLVYAVGVLFFKDRTRLEPWQLGLCALVLLASWLAPASEIVALVRGVLVLGLYAHLFWVAVTTAAPDLLEWRRKFRVGFLAVVALIGVAISAIELFGLDANLPPLIYPLHAALFAVIAATFLLFAMRIAPDIWPARSPKSPVPAELPSSHRAVLERLETAMANCIWREEGLTIGKLASHLDTSEHRLRRSINQGLGYRNFTSFINERRIEAAKEILADRTQADTPILTIAYDLGYGSLGPFNRAFRQATGDSPTEFRNRTIASG